MCLLFIASKDSNNVKSVFRFFLFYSLKVFVLEAKMGTNSSRLNNKDGEKLSHRIEKKNDIETTHIPYNSLREYGYDFKSKIIREDNL